MESLKDDFEEALQSRGLTGWARDYVITNEPGADLEWSTRVDFAFPARKVAFEVREPGETSSRKRGMMLQEAGWDFSVLTEDLFPLSEAALDFLLAKVG